MRPSVRTLAVHLNDVLVGYLTHYPDDKTIFMVDQTYIDSGSDRPVLSLSMARPNDEDLTQQLLADERHKSSTVKAPPFFSNLLPEGGLRKRIAAELKVHEDREFDLLLALGRDLPGAVVLSLADTPPYMKNRRNRAFTNLPSVPPEMKFSLGGMQLKFSMLQQGERYTLPAGDVLGNFIVKPPSNDFAGLPMIEAAAMETARAVGIDVPEVHLVDPDRIEGLKGLSGVRANEPFYAIRRFDRIDGGGRRHIEDFAQVFNLRVNDKYGRANYEQIGRTLLQYAGGIEDVREMSKRLMFNVLMGNGDAHLKNWSLLYDNPSRPRLAPAYDMVPTVAYTTSDKSIALNMGGLRDFKDISLGTFEKFLHRLGLLDQVRDDIMKTVIDVGRNILVAWEDHFFEMNVPSQLVYAVRNHQELLPLAFELKSDRTTVST